MSDQHSCEVVVFRCIDYRLSQGDFDGLLKRKGIAKDGKFDLVSVAGSGRDLLDKNPIIVRYLLGQIGTSIRLHHSQKAIIVLHDNCGAYGIADPVQELTKQKADAAKIAALIVGEFPDLAVEVYQLVGTASGEFSLQQLA